MKNRLLEKSSVRTGVRKRRTETVERPLRICIVFDDKDSASSAELLLSHVASDYDRETQLFRFEDLKSPEAGLAAARGAYGTDILILSVGDDGLLPRHVQLWLGLYVGSRPNNRAGALVTLIRKSHREPDSRSLLGYLETIAAIGGLTFLPRLPAEQAHR